MWICLWVVRLELKPCNDALWVGGKINKKTMTTVEMNRNEDLGMTAVVFLMYWSVYWYVMPLPVFYHKIGSDMCVCV